MSNWFSIEDQYKPDEGQICLVAYKWYSEKHITIATYNWQGIFISTGYHSERIETATHWMTLPELPKEDI